MKQYTWLCFFSLFIIGCVKNEFQEFYTPLPQSFDNSQIETCATPQVQALPKDISDYDLNTMMFIEGYTLIGSSEWNGPSVNDVHSEAIKQGQRIGACMVLISTSHTGTEHNIMPMTTYRHGTTSTITTPSGGFATINSPGTTTTNYVPYSVSKYDYVSLYYAKLKELPQFLGVAMDYAPTWYMQKTDSRKGILVVGVRKNSPAYKANIFKDDIISKINDTAYSFDEKFPLKNGENLLEIYRNGEVLVKSVYLKKN